MRSELTLAESCGDERILGCLVGMFFPDLVQIIHKGMVKFFNWDMSNNWCKHILAAFPNLTEPEQLVLDECLDVALVANVLGRAEDTIPFRTPS